MSVCYTQRMCPHHARGEMRQGQDKKVQHVQPEAEDANIGITSTEDTGIGEVRRCAGCHRFEPKFASSSKQFVDVGDSETGRCVCLECCDSIVTTSDEAMPLWEKVVNFFEGQLGLITDTESISGVSRQSLMNIPVMVVGLNALNDNMKSHPSEGIHYKSSQIMTKGLCLSEFSISSHNEGKVFVNAILCLSGLPSDLTMSILAHECMHAFIKLHPNFRYGKQLPVMVEEGLCQLAAFLFLSDCLEPCQDHSYNPSRSKRLQYFKFCIETDQGVYGQGFRAAARSYADIGLQELLYYVALNHNFPPLH